MRQLLRGVIIFGTADDRISSARFYLEPVELDAAGVHSAITDVVGSR